MNPVSRVLLFAGSCLLVFHASPLLAANGGNKVLIVVSGEGRQQGLQRPGYEFDELSQAWLVFTANGLQVEVASPGGGPVEPDAYDPSAPFNAALLADATAMRSLARTRATASLDAADYAAIYVVGGKGAMFDLPRDAALHRLLGQVWDNGGVIAAVCHGPAALVDVRLADGSALVSGRRLTGMSKEEALFGKQWAAQFPWLLEDIMRQRGALWHEAPLMMPHVVVDGRLITGQNPLSTTALAEAVVRATGRTPVARVMWPDEPSLVLVEQVLAGDRAGAAAAWAADPPRYRADLIGGLGYYQAQAAVDDAALEQALQLIELALPHTSKPRLKVAAAEAHLKLGRPAQARTLVLQVLRDAPNLAPAKALLQRIDG